MGVSGLKCDNPNCTYKDDSVQRFEYEASINKPCPECGEPLLTQKDCDAVVFMEKMDNNPIIRMIGKLSGRKTKVTLHGKGFEDIELEEVDR